LVDKLALHHRPLGDPVGPAVFYQAPHLDP
jgi:hypothetical protein